MLKEQSLNSNERTFIAVNFQKFILIKYLMSKYIVRYLEGYQWK